MRVSFSVPAHDGNSTVTEVTIACDQPDFCVLDLSPASIAAQLAHQFDDVVQAPDMRLRQQATVGVGGERSVKSQTATLDERSTLTLFTKTEILKLTDDRISEAVVNLGNINVGMGYTSHLESALCGLGNAKACDVGPLGNGARLVWVSCRCA